MALRFPTSPGSIAAFSSPSTNDFDRKGASNVVAELKKLASTFARSAGSDPADVRIEYTLEARYHHQVWEIDIAVDIDRLLGEGGAKNLEENFHRAHEQIFAFRDPDSPVEVIAWRASVRSKTGLDTDLTLSQSGAPQQERTITPRLLRVSRLGRGARVRISRSRDWQGGQRSGDRRVAVHFHCHRARRDVLAHGVQQSRP